MRREFIVKPSIEFKPTQDKLKPNPKHKECEDTSVLVVTRAQAQQAREQRVDSSNPESSNSQQRRRKTRNWRKKSKVNNSKMDIGFKERQNQTRNPKIERERKTRSSSGENPAFSETKSNEGGFVIVDKVNETLEALLKA